MQKLTFKILAPGELVGVSNALSVKALGDT
jgi:hypothetical protein